MSDPVTAAAWVAVAIAGAGAVSSNVQQNRMQAAQERSARKQEEAAKKQLAAEDEAQNRANARQADIEGLLSASDPTGAMGGSTTLTGASGAPVSSGLLGKGGTLGG